MAASWHWLGINLTLMMNHREAPSEPPAPWIWGAGLGSCSEWKASLPAAPLAPQIHPPWNFRNKSTPSPNLATSLFHLKLFNASSSTQQHRGIIRGLSKEIRALIKLASEPSFSGNEQRACWEDSRYVKLEWLNRTDCNCQHQARICVLHT